MKYLIVLVAFILGFTKAIDFEYEMPGWKRLLCFGDYLGQNINVFLEVELITEPIVSVRIKDPSSDYIVLDAQKKMAFAWTTEQEGNYEICFQKNSSSIANLKVSYKSGVEANDYSELTSKDDIKPIEVQIQKMDDMVNIIKNEMRMLVHHSERRQANIKDISFRIIGFSVITLAMLVLLALFQVSYLKSFFKSKKLI